jgi:hypothetical protein
MISVHDEIGFVCEDIPKDVLDTEIRTIQELLKHKMDVVDIIADVEITTTSWSEKGEYVYV